MDASHSRRMGQGSGSIWRWWLTRLVYLLVGTVICIGLLSAVITNAVETGTPAWSSPSQMALRRASSLPSSQSEPNFLNNMDCTLVDYRLAATSQMRNGCFTESAFGFLDSDAQMVLFNGTDEGLPLIPYVPNQALVPWPRAGTVMALDTVSTGGSYVSLYKGLTSVLADKRNHLLQVTAKQITAPPNLRLTDSAGQRLVINAQTLAFSDTGAWLVAETLNGSFVRINLASLEMKAFAPSFGSTGSPALLQSRVAISDNGRYAAIANQAAGSFKVYDLSKCSGQPANLEPENCPSYDYRPFIQSQIAGLGSIRHVRFANNGLISFEAAASSPGSDGIYLLAPAGSIDSLIDYLGTGDSYTSGEGAFNYLSGTDTDDNRCHLSVHSYPMLLTNDLFSSRGGHSVACSGAKINDIGSTSDSYRGQVRGGAKYRDIEPAFLDSVMTNFLPGYIAQQRFAAHYQPVTMTVSIGGNDVGFGDILEQCVMIHASRHLSDNVCFDTYEDRMEILRLIDRTVPKWVALYKQLQITSPLTRLYAIGYPSIAVDNGSCGVNVWANKSELEFAQEIVVYLNASIKKAANKAGVVYVDIEKALVGHRLCETASYNLAVNGLTAGKDNGAFGIKMFGNESYHPNALGHRLIEQAILRQTNNLTLAIPASTGNPDAQKLLNAPRSGRAINTRLPVSDLTTRLADPNQPIPIYASGADNGLKPHTPYTVHLDGPAGPSVGTITSDENGDIGGSVTLPPSTAPGGYTIDITGPHQTGDPVNITQPIEIPPNPAPDSTGTPTNSPSPPPTNTSNPTASSSSTSTGSIGAGALSVTTSSNASQAPASYSSGRVLGASTANPAVAKTIKPSSVTTKQTRPDSKLKILNWLPWLGLFLLAWILILLAGYWLSRFIVRKRYVPSGPFQLQ